MKTVFRLHQSANINILKMIISRPFGFNRDLKRKLSLPTGLVSGIGGFGGLKNRKEG